MKHYAQREEMPNDLSEALELYAPVDGEITNLRLSEGAVGTEAQFGLESADHPEVVFVYFHVTLDDAIHEGSVVAAGDVLGIGAVGEIAVEYRGETDSALWSFFQLATESVLDEYRERGVDPHQELLITEDERDANPLLCEDDRVDGDFAGRAGVTESQKSFNDWQQSDANWVVLDRV